MLFVFLIVGILLFVLGVVIWKYNYAGIIAGYDEEKTKNKRGLTKWVGLNLIIMGILSILISISGRWLISYLNLSTTWLIVMFIIVISIFSLRTALGYKKYEK